MSKRTALSAALAASRVEKDVENAYRAEVSAQRADVSWSSPHATDGLAVWSSESAPPVNVRLLLEAKYDLDFKQRGPVCSVLGQMLLYLKRFETAGGTMPNVLLVGDRNECFVLATDAVRGFLSLNLDWNVAPSTGSPELTRALVSGFNLLPYVYDVNGDLDFGDVLAKVETLAAGNEHRVRATRANLGAIFVYWRDNVFRGTGKSALTPTEQVDVFLRCLFHPDDVRPHPTKRGVLVVPGYDDGAVVINADQYRSFFTHFEQGYKPSEVESFYADKDRLVEDDARRRQGAFFTPAIWSEQAHKELDRALGPNWRRECVVWDCAAGTGNLTRDYDDWGCLISSTAERPDVNVMREQGWGGHHVFQYDFLNDNAQSPFFALDDGDNRVPSRVDKVLRDAAKSGKRLVFFMNPPYGTANNAGTEVGDHKAGIALTEVNKQMKAAKLGKPSGQLYAQFMYRASTVAKEYGFHDTTIALFSGVTFMCSGSYRMLRSWWYGRHKYVAGFMFQASHFADVSGAWSVSFTVWNSGGETNSKGRLPISLTDVKNFSVAVTGSKSLYNSDDRDASEWLGRRQRGHVGDTPKFSSGLKVGGGWDGGSMPGSLGVLVNVANCIYKSSTGVFMLPGNPTGRMQGHLDILASNWRRVVALFAARKLVLDDWMVHQDEYLAPTAKTEASAAYNRWVDDCHVYALLETKNNCTAMRDVQYKGKSWRIKNHWFWRTRAASLAALDTRETSALYRDCKSEPTKKNERNHFTGEATAQPWEVTGDPYFAHVLPSLNLSPDARKVLDLLDALWVKSLPLREGYAAGRPELHLAAWDAGVYQLKHLWRDLFPTEWAELTAAHKALAARLQDGVYDHGFLRR
jgi:hypothetical protein